ncbi:PREDICTED: interferon-inducible double-stranded RNA-dependent protein kinase activator A homolog B-like [Ceratosolen solmsi marchali]|uniref:Interferon-inducible double-stranded RNA-dependent protein kinase activator A homolog B-like n=1 Tax=Ceratosolen solmsi marchali TaxID=326594 RepID=A0AAJ6YUM5_9HYME|nr:PREDICTED: interferon-inducible double-stranded RNA-dependent protein kinase activator A homolog B-like [Ceratosolen solmsi marchali]
MKKTPVSILQEMMVKKGGIPNYELIYNGGGSHQNVFTYQVLCDGLQASGTGRCKKDAKHKAATAMLEVIAKEKGLLQLPASPCKSPIKSPIPKLPESPKLTTNVEFRNTIGELQDFCSLTNLDDPLYKETGNIGPAHAKVFTVQCLVSTFIEEGTATTKKQAKHEAARKMLNRISSVVTDGVINKLSDSKTNMMDIRNEVAIAKYGKLSKTNNEIVKPKVNWGVKISNYYKSLKERLSEQERNEFLVLLEDIEIGLENIANTHELKQKFENVMESFEIPVYYMKYSSNKNFNTKSIISIKLNTAPDIQEFGYGQNIMSAEANAIKNIIDTVKSLLQ